MIEYYSKFVEEVDDEEKKPNKENWRRPGNIGKTAGWEKSKWIGEFLTKIF